ncbi:MAG: HYR domain-containing protein [Phycisphaeraceae bacterium]|nr:MAG: HYR domain-containing protein [Phycisphaeraceae bacterium]
MGTFEADRPLLYGSLAGSATRDLGDTFDSEVLVADTPAINEFAWVSVAPLGQSLLASGFYTFAGVNQFNGFDVEAGVGEFDNGDGTYTIVASTRTARFSDGFLPYGYTFSPSGTPIDAIGWLFGAGGDRDGAPDPYDPQLAVPFPPSGEFTVVGADVYLLDNGFVIGSGTFAELPLLNQTEIGFLVTVADAAGGNVDEMIVQYLVQSANADPEIVLVPQDDCLGVGETQLVVEIDSRGLVDYCVGGQFFLEYDNALLDFVSAVPGDGPFAREVYEDADEIAGTIDYAVGVPDGDAGAVAPTTMARLTFEVLDEFCAVADLVRFRTHAPPSRLTDAWGTDLGAATINLAEVTHDTTPPTIDAPADLTVRADAGGCDALVATGAPVAIDDCSAVSITFERSDNAALGPGDPFPGGTTTITWTATDACGNSASDVQFVTVEGVNDLEVSVALQAVDPGPFDRCIAFELIPAGGGVPVQVSETLTFVGGIGSATIEIPCGDYACITARDPLHTLRATDNDDFAIVGAVYAAAFLASPGDDDALVGGNLNGDQFVDVLDFGVFISQYGATPGANSPCGTPSPHADISGDGVVSAADFTFIQINFLKGHEARCDGSFLIRPGGPGLSSRPVERITLDELERRGLGVLGSGDLNHDGALDVDDIAAFTGGARPDHLADLDGDGVIGVADVIAAADALRSGGVAGDVDRDGLAGLADVWFVIDRLGLEVGSHH